MAGCHKLAFIDFQNTAGLFAFPPKTRRAHQSPRCRLGSDYIAIHAAVLCATAGGTLGLMKMRNEGFDKGTFIAQTIRRGVSAWHLSTADVVTRSVNIDIYHCINISLAHTSAFSFGCRLWKSEPARSDASPRTNQSADFWASLGVRS